MEIGCVGPNAHTYHPSCRSCGAKGHAVNQSCLIHSLAQAGILHFE